LRAIQEGNSCLLSTGAPDSPVHHRTLSGADLFPILAQPTIDDLEPLAHRTLFGAHRTVRCTPDSPVPPSDRWPGHASRADCAVDRWLTGQSGAPPDSPVIYSRTPLFCSRERPVDQRQPGAPDTVRCTQTEQSLGCSSQVFSIYLFSDSST
jgi:hypothetical protein